MYPQLTVERSLQTVRFALDSKSKAERSHPLEDCEGAVKKPSSRFDAESPYSLQ